MGLIWWFETASKALRLEDEALDSELPAVAVAYSEHLASLLLDPMKLSLLGEFPSTRYGDSSEFEMIFTAADTDSFKPAIKGIVQYLGTRRDQGFVGRDNFDVLVVRAVVPIGSIDDPRLRGVLLASIVANLHLPLPEGDLVIISLVQRTSEGKRCKVAYFAIHGKEHVAKDVFDAWYASFAPKCV